MLLTGDEEALATAFGHRDLGEGGAVFTKGHVVVDAFHGDVAIVVEVDEVVAAMAVATADDVVGPFKVVGFLHELAIGLDEGGVVEVFEGVLVNGIAIFVDGMDGFIDFGAGGFFHEDAELSIADANFSIDDEIAEAEGVGGIVGGNIERGNVDVVLIGAVG